MVEQTTRLRTIQRFSFEQNSKEPPCFSSNQTCGNSGFNGSITKAGKNKRSSKAQKILPSDKKLLEIPEDCGLKVQIEPPTPLMEESLGDILFSEQWGLQLELGFMDWPNEDNAIMQKGCRTLRILTFYSTQFPGPNYHCREVILICCSCMLHAPIERK